MIHDRKRIFWQDFNNYRLLFDFYQPILQILRVIFVIKHLSMKKIYNLLKTAVLLMPSLAVAQSATSVANGNWTNPLTWNCTCVPISGYSVTINHSVTLNTSMVFNTGGITINNTGSLMQDASLNRDIWINGGYMNNGGKANFRYFLLSSGVGSNTGNFTVSAMTNSVSYNNSGSITMDSMYVAGTFMNSANGRIIGDSITNASTFTNYGRVNVTWSTNKGTFNNYNYQGGYSTTNDGTYINSDSVVMTGSMWNKILFTNNTGALVRLTKNFHNYKLGNTARFDNRGNVIVLDSWYNTDTVKGTNTGTFTVSDTSANSGWMKGNFKFCDLTPPAFAPFVDLNSGSISAAITWCATSGINEYGIENNVIAYPNPSSGSFTIKGTEKDKLILADELGRIIYTIELNENNGFSVNINGLENGIYFLRGNSVNRKIAVAK